MGDNNNPRLLSIVKEVSEALLDLDRIRHDCIYAHRSTHQRGHHEFRPDTKSFQRDADRYVRRAFGKLRLAIKRLDDAQFQKKETQYENIMMAAAAHSADDSERHDGMDVVKV